MPFHRTDPESVLQAALHRIETNHRRLTDLMADITALKQAIEADTAAVEAAVAALGTAQKPSQAEVDALTTQVQANTQTLAKAVAPPAPPVGP